MNGSLSCSAFYVGLSRIPTVLTEPVVHSRDLALAGVSSVFSVSHVDHPHAKAPQTGGKAG